MVNQAPTSELQPTGDHALTAKPSPLAEMAAARDWLVPGADEMFRGIYTRAGLAQSETLAVCSAIAGEGKTTIAVGLGTTMAQDYPDRRVLVVETDFWRPVFAEDFEVDDYPGLADCLVEELSLQLAVRPTTLENLFLVPAGRPVSNAGRLLRSTRMAAAIATLRRSYDVIILDVPAMLVNSDALPVIDLADGALFVVRAGVTPGPLVRKAMAQLDDTRGLLRGVVLNGTESAVPTWLRRLCGL